MNFVNYYLSNKNYKEIRTENHKKDEELRYEEYLINMIIPISGVPFCKQSRLNRQVKIDRADK